jgi:3'(2'), 5'-bisphosphate nucleotidase
MGPQGTWVEVTPQKIVCGPDDPDRTARSVLDSLPDLTAPRTSPGPGVYLIGFQHRDTQRAAKSMHCRGKMGHWQDAPPTKCRAVSIR